MTLGKVARWFVRGGGVLAAAAFVWLVALSGTDPASTILFALAILAVAAALVCVDRAIDARGTRGRLLWIGRMLGLLGAAVAISFPAELYQEIRMLLSRGEAPAAWFPRAIWYQAATIPMIVLPALIALRWRRLGAVLFVMSGSFNIVESLYQPFGAIFPEATGSGWTGISAIDLVLQPAFVTAGLLLLGSTGSESGGSGVRSFRPPQAPGADHSIKPWLRA